MCMSSHTSNALDPESTHWNLMLKCVADNLISHENERAVCLTIMIRFHIEKIFAHSFHVSLSSAFSAFQPESLFSGQKRRTHKSTQTLAPPDLKYEKVKLFTLRIISKNVYGRWKCTQQQKQQRKSLKLIFQWNWYCNLVLIQLQSIFRKVRQKLHTCNAVPC